MQRVSSEVWRPTQQTWWFVDKRRAIARRGAGGLGNSSFSGENTESELRGKQYRVDEHDGKYVCNVSNVRLSYIVIKYSNEMDQVKCTGLVPIALLTSLLDLGLVIFELPSPYFLYFLQTDNSLFLLFRCLSFHPIQSCFGDHSVKLSERRLSDL